MKGKTNKTCSVGVVGSDLTTRSIPASAVCGCLVEVDEETMEVLNALVEASGKGVESILDDALSNYMAEKGGSV